MRHNHSFRWCPAVHPGGRRGDTQLPALGCGPGGGRPVCRRLCGQHPGVPVCVSAGRWRSDASLPPSPSLSLSLLLSRPAPGCVFMPRPVSTCISLPLHASPCLAMPRHASPCLCMPPPAPAYLCLPLPLRVSCWQVTMRPCHLGWLPPARYGASLMESVTWCSLVSSGIAFLSIVATDDLPTAIRCAGMRWVCGRAHMWQ